MKTVMGAFRIQKNLGVRYEEPFENRLWVSIKNQLEPYGLKRWPQYFKGQSFHWISKMTQTTLTYCAIQVQSHSYTKFECQRLRSISERDNRRLPIDSIIDHLERIRLSPLKIQDKQFLYYQRNKPSTLKVRVKSEHFLFYQNLACDQ